MGEIDSEIIGWIEAHQEELIMLACEFIAVPSVSGSEGAFALRIAEWMQRKGLETRLSCVPEGFRDRFPEFSGEENLVARPNLYAWLRATRPTAAPPVVVNGHLDVVPVGDPARWRFGPFSAHRAEGAIWGRGAADMKGPIAAGLMAVLALKECAVPLSTDIQVQLVMGEETGGLGSLYALSEQTRPQAAIVLEPSDCRIVSAGAGSVQFTVTATGKSAHGCAPWEGESALHRLLACLGRIEAYAVRRNKSLSHALFGEYPQPAPLNIGMFSAGEWRVMVPESGQFSGRLGILPGEEIGRIRDEMEREVRICRQELGLAESALRIDWPNLGFPAWETPASAPIIGALQFAAAITGTTVELKGVTFGSDAGHFARLGIPVAIFGPGDIAVAHMPDEHLSERSLTEAAKVLALALARLAA